MCYKERPRANPGSGGSFRGWGPAVEVLSLGLTMGVCLALGIGIGVAIDGRFETSPWGVGLGLLWGLGAAVTQAWRILARSSGVRINGADGQNRPDGS